jgi:hypothetical protein
MKTIKILKILEVFVWIAFIEMCIEPGIILTSFIVSLFNPGASADLYLGMDFSELYHFNVSHYISMISLIIFIYAGKAFLVFQLLKILDKVNISNPFTDLVGRRISKMSTISLWIGILSILSKGYYKWLLKQDLQLHLDFAAKEFLILAGILFVLSQVFKRGIELQSENELTI